MYELRQLIQSAILSRRNMSIAYVLDRDKEIKLAELLYCERFSLLDTYLDEHM